MSDDVVERLRAELKRFEAHGPKECAQNIRDAIAEIDKLRSIYQSAVHGRREMRHALKEERLRAAPTDRAAVVEEWQTIETAPKDGTHVIVGTFPAVSGQVTTTVAHWFDSRAYGAKSGGAGWALSVNYDGEHSDHGVQAPTHWMPLPSPPATDKGT